MAFEVRLRLEQPEANVVKFRLFILEVIARVQDAVVVDEAHISPEIGRSELVLFRKSLDEIEGFDLASRGGRDVG